MFSAIVATALALNQFFSAPTLAGAHAGAIVIDAQTGNVLYARNASDAFIPASTMKLIVGSAALDILDEAFNFTTTVTTDGSNLYLVGGGDTLLEQSDLDDAANAVVKGGITTFAGTLRGDNTRYDAPRYPDGWQVDDLAYDYAAPVSALSFSHNAIHITILPGSTYDAPTTMDFTPHIAARQNPNIVTTQIMNHVTGTGSDREDTTALVTYWSQPFTIEVNGLLPAASKEPGELDAAMLNPAADTLDLFSQTLAARGVQFAAPPIFGMSDSTYRVLWRHHSILLHELLGAMWRPSDNLLAETLLEEIGLRSTPGYDTRTRGIMGEQQWLKSLGIDPKTVTIADGSGMSSYDRVTPTVLVKVLSHDFLPTHRGVVLNALPTSGSSGTLEHLFTESPLAGNVFAKTGTSNHTRTLAGYIRTPSGWRIFALMINDWMDSGPGSADRLHVFQSAFLRGTYEGTASR